MSEDIETYCKRLRKEPPPKRKEMILAIRESNPERFYIEIGFWFTEPDVLDDMRIKMRPTPPKEIIEFRRLSREDKNKVVPHYWHLPGVQEYLEQDSQVQSTNKGNLEILEEILTHIPKTEYYIHRVLSQKILDFKQGAIDG